jgi:hypothetical protein
MSFAPALAPAARKAISHTIRAWHLRSRTTEDLSSLAREINPQVSGWIGYYGAFYRSELHFLAYRIDQHLVRWARHKFKRLRYSPKLCRRAGKSGGSFEARTSQAWVQSSPKSNA